MSEQSQEPEVWAVVDLMGHIRIAGRITEIERFGAKMGRIDVPNGDGEFVTRLFTASSVYSITFVTEAVARDIARRENNTAPVSPWDYPRAIATSESTNSGHDNDEY